MDDEKEKTINAIGAASLSILGGMGHLYLGVKRGYVFLACSFAMIIISQFFWPMGWLFYIQLAIFPPLMPSHLLNEAMVSSKMFVRMGLDDRETCLLKTGYVGYLHLILLCLLLWNQIVFDIEAVYASDKATPTVIVSDVLTHPGKPVQLEARVFEKGLLGREIALGGETLEYSVQGQIIGTTMTGGDGRAFLEFAPRMRGNLTVKVRLPESSRVLSAEGTGLLASWEKRRPLLLIDLVSMMQEKSNPQKSLPSLPLNLSPTVLGEVDPDAPQELEKLGRFYYNLIYLHRSDVGDTEILQEWIRTHEIPPGFPKVISSGRQPLEELIEQLEEEGWANVTGGIGRTPDFAEVLVESRLKAVILHDPEDKEDFPRRAILIESWKKVRKHL